MRWPAFQWILIFVAVIMLQEWATAAPRGEDMFKELLKLDKMYSSIARPSLRSGPVQTEIRPKVVQRAMLRLQELDRLYADRARPRFGKRTHTDADLVPVDYDGQYQSMQDVAEWLPVRR